MNFDYKPDYYYVWNNFYNLKASLSLDKLDLSLIPNIRGYIKRNLSKLNKFAFLVGEDQNGNLL